MEQIVHSISGVPQSYWLMQSGSCCPIFKCSGGAKLCMWQDGGYPTTTHSIYHIPELTIESSFL